MMDVSSSVLGLDADHGVVGEGGAKVVLSQSGWSRATLFLFDHEMGYDEAAVREYIGGRVSLVISGFGGCCSLTRSAQCGACGLSHEIAFACRVVLLGANALPPSFKSWHELDLLRRMVRSELARQCELEGSDIEDRLCGVVGCSVIYAEAHGELDLVDWDVDNAFLLLQAPSAWVEFAFVLSYSGLPVYVPSCSLVGDICTLRGDYRSGPGSVLGRVGGVVGE